MEEEYALFMNELKDAENEQEKEDDVEEEAFSLERDVSNINEHVSLISSFSCLLCNHIIIVYIVTVSPILNLVFKSVFIVP